MTGDWLSAFGTDFGYDVYHDFLDAAEAANIKKVGAKFGLNSRESLAVYAYTAGERLKQSPFEHVNAFLRTGIPSGIFVKSLAADLKTALPKLPRFQGIVYRKTTLPSDIRDLVVAGATFKDPAFLSTSKNPNVFDGLDMMLISASKGIHIFELSAFRGEDEVLFLPGTEFRIERVDDVAGGKLLEMTEL